MDPFEIVKMMDKVCSEHSCSRKQHMILQASIQRLQQVVTEWKAFKDKEEAEAKEAEELAAEEVEKKVSEVYSKASKRKMTRKSSE